MDESKELKKIPLAGELPETKLPPVEPLNVAPTIIDTNQPKDYSHLPVGTQTSLELDKKSLLPAAPVPVNNGTNNIVPKSVLKNDFSKKFFKIGLGIFGVFIACFLIFLLLSITNIDTQFMKITLSGQITDINTGKTIENASVLINGIETTKTNAQGRYSIANLSTGDIQVTVKADGYDETTESVRVSKVLLDYSTRKDFSLKSAITGVLSGKFIPNSADYKFTNDKLLIGEKQYLVNDDGTFAVNDVKVGEIEFKFNSVNFKDISQSISLQAGTNRIPDITLAQGGDIVGELKSYIKEDLVLNTKFYVENILQDQVIITEDGKFTIKDLDTDKKYKIRVSADGYITRDYEINIKQGENQLFNFRLVENGVAIYPLRSGESNSDPIKLYRSDFDGENQSVLVDDSRIDNYTKFFSIEEQKLYYQSFKDESFRQENSGVELKMPYQLDINNSVPDRMTISTNNLGQLTANFIAKKMLSQYTKQGAISQPGLQIMNIDGTNRKEVKMLTNTSFKFGNLRISNNGKYVLYSFQNNNQTELYLFNIETEETKNVLNNQNITVYDISEDGSNVLLSRKNPNTGLIDLALVNVPSDDLRTLKENIKGFGYQFVKGNTNKVIFFESRESRSNIYTFTIDRSQEEKITSLTPDYTITGIYQESNLLFYQTNRGLLLLDLNKPKNFKLVSAQAYNFFK